MSDDTCDELAAKAALGDQVAAYLAQGGLISKLDYAGNLVGLVTEQPQAKPASKPVREARPAVQLAPVEVIPEPVLTRRPAPTAQPAKPVAPAPQKPASAPTGNVVDITSELRRIRSDATSWLARLNAAATQTKDAA